MPLPSTACQTCKNRRIKCDETKPTCKRCSKSNRLCLDSAAAKAASFSIHLENEYASGRTKRPRGPRLTVIRPSINVQACALAYYVRYHLQELKDAPNVSGCLSECVAHWKSSGRTSELVDLAISTMSLAVYARVYGHCGAATEAATNYQRLLKASQSMIIQVNNARLDAASIDACLLATAFLGRYEGVVGSFEVVGDSLRPSNSTKTWHHHDGSIAILQAWNDGLIQDTNIASFIMKHARRGVLGSFLMRNRPLPDWLADGKNFGEHGMELEYDQIYVRILNLRQRFTESKQGNSIVPVNCLIDEATDIGHKLQTFSVYLSETCLYRQHVLDNIGSFPQKHFLSPVIYSFQKYGHAAIWAQYFATEMLINKLQFEILQFSCSDSVHQQQIDCLAAIDSMGYSLASTIPFCLERFYIPKENLASITMNSNPNITPHLMNSVVWPLAVASGLPGINPKQLTWFREELSFLGQIVGDCIFQNAVTSCWVIA